MTNRVAYYLALNDVARGDPRLAACCKQLWKGLYRAARGSRDGISWVIQGSRETVSIDLLGQARIMYQGPVMTRDQVLRLPVRLDWARWS